MNEQRSGGTENEPSLTQKNSETVKGEETLADRGAAQGEVEGTSTRTKIGAIPSSYGAPGGLSEQAPGDTIDRVPNADEE
jgi:hypothetical protein